MLTDFQHKQAVMNNLITTWQKLLTCSLDISKSYLIFPQMSLMSNSLLSLLVLLLFSTSLLSQDSSNSPEKDTAYWNLVLSARKAQNKMERYKLDSIANLILDYAAQKDNQDYHHYALFFKAEALARTNPSASIEKAKQALDYFEKKEDHSKCSRISNALGHGYSNSGDTDTALKFYRKAIEHSKKFEKSDHPGEVRFRSATLYNMGYAFIKKGNLDQGSELLYEALKEVKPNNDTMVISSIYVQLGNIKTLRKKYEEALEWYEKALDLSGENCVPCRVITMTSIAGSYQELGKLDSAIVYYDEVFPLLRKSNNIVSLCIALYNQAGLYIAKEMHELAIENARELINVSIEGGLKKHEVNGYYVLAEALHNLNQNNEAKNVIQKALMDLDTLNEFHTTASIYELASKIFESNSEFKIALDHQKKFKMYSDSILNKESLARIDELSMVHDTKEKEAKIVELKNEKALSDLRFRQNLTLGIGVFLFSILSGMVYILYINQKRIKIEKQKDSIEQRLLRSQMNPHFIFNAISSIQTYLFEKSEVKIALEYLSKFAMLMRQILENSREEFIPLSEEIDALENYLQLQQLRYSYNFNYEINIADDIDPEDFLIPPLMAQPFVENAIEHGLIYKKEDGLVKINFSSMDDKLTLSIEDNGVGKNSHKIEKEINQIKKSSLASLITKERLELISDVNKNKFEMLISEMKTGGTSVTIQLPKVMVA